MTQNSGALTDCENRHPRDPLVKKVLALLVPRGNSEVFEAAKKALAEVWGEPERVSPLFPFVWTNYYEDIAAQLDRIFFSYPGLYPMSKLPDWKVLTCALERASGPSRRVNQDPGTLDGARLLLATGVLALVAACAPLGNAHPEYPVGRARLVLAPGQWVDLGHSEESLPLLPELGATVPLQTRIVGLRGPGQEWLAVLRIQTNSTNFPPHNPTLWTGSCPAQQGVWVEDATAASPVRIDCLRFKRWANNRDDWLGKNHPDWAQWLGMHQVQLTRPASYISYRYATEGGAYVAVTALVDQRLLIPKTRSNDEFLRSGQPAQDWMGQLRTAVQQSVGMLDGHLAVPAFPLAVSP